MYGRMADVVTNVNLWECVPWNYVSLHNFIYNDTRIAADVDEQQDKFHIRVSNGNQKE